ncbi:MAG: ABC-2 transporter permease [Pygmaiobacter sp.]
MRGLLLKDLLNLTKYMRQLFFIVVMITLLSSVGGSSISFLSTYTVLLCVMIVLSSMSYDDFARWDTYALTMPLSRRTLVASKYLLGLLMAAVGSVISLMLSCLVGVFSKAAAPDETLLVIGATACICLVLLAVLLPLLYKFGVEKSRMMLLGVLMVPAIGILLLAKFGFSAPSEAVLLAMLIGLPFVALGSLAVSFFISVAIVTKKEY